MRKKIGAICAVLILFALGCSSSSADEQISSVVAEGNALIALGDKAYNRLDLNSALKLYEEAFRQYSLVDYIPGKIASALAAGGTANELGEFNASEMFLNRAVNLNAGQFGGLILLARIENSFENKSYDETAELCGEWLNEFSDTEGTQQVLCYLMLSNAALGIPSDSQFNQLNSSLRMGEISASATAFVSFSLGRREYQSGSFDSAEKFFLRALTLDKQAGSQRNIAQDLLWLGKANLKLNNPEQAENYLRRSVESYEAMSAFDKAQVVEKLLGTIKK